MEFEEVECPRCVGTGVRKIHRKFRKGTSKHHRLQTIECEACRGTGYVSIMIITETPTD